MFLVPEPPLTGCGQAMCVCLCTAPRVLDKAVVRREGVEREHGVAGRGLQEGLWGGGGHSGHTLEPCLSAGQP